MHALIWRWIKSTISIKQKVHTCKRKACYTKTNRHMVSQRHLYWILSRRISSLFMHIKRISISALSLLCFFSSIGDELRSVWCGVAAPPRRENSVFLVLFLAMQLVPANTSKTTPQIASDTYTSIFFGNYPSKITPDIFFKKSLEWYKNCK